MIMVIMLVVMIMHHVEDLEYDDDGVDDDSVDDDWQDDDDKY